MIENKNMVSLSYKLLGILFDSFSILCDPALRLLRLINAGSRDREHTIAGWLKAIQAGRKNSERNGICCCAISRAK